MSRPNLVDTEEEARRIRETFVDRESGSRKRMPFTWPKRLQVIGKCVAVEYRSDKWKQRREWDEYKHIAEAPQEFLACKDFLTPWEKPTHPIKVHGPTVELLQPMPKHFAELAPLLGVQVQLFGPGGKVQGDQGIVEVRVTRGMLEIGRASCRERV